jgi:hypothetical protein
MIDTCIGLLKDVIDLVVKNKQIEKENKFRVAILLEEMSKVLEDTATKLSKNEYPHFNCALMDKMSDHLNFRLTDFVPKEQLEELHNSLREASQVEKQFATREEPRTISSIYEAAATFKTFSLLLKV